MILAVRWIDADHLRVELSAPADAALIDPADIIVWTSPPPSPSGVSPDSVNQAGPAAWLLDMGGRPVAVGQEFVFTPCTATPVGAFDGLIAA